MQKALRDSHLDWPGALPPRLSCLRLGWLDSGRGPGMPKAGLAGQWPLTQSSAGTLQGREQGHLAGLHHGASTQAGLSGPLGGSPGLGSGNSLPPPTGPVWSARRQAGRRLRSRGLGVVRDSGSDPPPTPGRRLPGGVVEGGQLQARSGSEAAPPEPALFLEETPLLPGLGARPKRPRVPRLTWAGPAHPGAPGQEPSIRGSWDMMPL